MLRSTGKRHFSTLISKRRRQKHDEFTAQAEEAKERKETGQKRADKDENVKEKILDAALAVVPDLGFSQEAIKKGVEMAGLPKVSNGIITNGPIDLVHHHYEKANSLLEVGMKDEIKGLEDSTEVKAVPFLRKHCQKRLQMNVPYMKHWPQALGMMALPSNHAKSLNYGLNLVDTMWYCAGDRSLDYNWYSKRLMLLGVLKSTELVMLSDNSKDFKDSWEFLDRRFSDIRDLSGIIKSGHITNDVSSVLGGLGQTAKVLFGLPR